MTSFCFYGRYGLCHSKNYSFEFRLKVAQVTSYVGELPFELDLQTTSHWLCDWRQQTVRGVIWDGVGKRAFSFVNL